MKQKNGKVLFLVVAMGLVLAFATSCEPETALTAIPEVTTTAQSDVAQTSAMSGGTVTSDGGSAVTARGVCYGTTATPTLADSKTTDGQDVGVFTSSITGLTANTTYYVRAYATNSNGTGYGNEISFTTLQSSGGITYGTMSDCDGNTYVTVVIDTQTWMAENLKTTKYNDGTDIPLVTDNSAWSTLSTPGYCWYNNDEASYKATYGAMYNQYVVNTGKLAPIGWHVPTDAEWNELITMIGGGSVAGSRLKEMGNTHWTSLNTDATNVTGFSALPGGNRYTNGTFGTIGLGGSWWGIPGSVTMSCNFAGAAVTGVNSKFGFSVRCRKD